jgi:hypothetical protein
MTLAPGLRTTASVNRYENQVHDTGLLDPVSPAKLFGLLAAKPLGGLPVTVDTEIEADVRAGPAGPGRCIQAKNRRAECGSDVDGAGVG